MKHSRGIDGNSEAHVTRPKSPVPFAPHPTDVQTTHEEVLARCRGAGPRGRIVLGQGGQSIFETLAAAGREDPSLTADVRRDLLEELERARRSAAADVAARFPGETPETLQAALARALSMLEAPADRPAEPLAPVPARRLEVESQASVSGTSVPPPGERRGTVFLVEEDGANGPGWYGYWEQSPDGEPRCLEDAGYHPTLASALAWGRARSEQVLVRFEGTGEYRWAGTSEAPPDLRPLEEPD